MSDVFIMTNFTPADMPGAKKAAPAPKPAAKKAAPAPKVKEAKLEETVVTPEVELAGDSE
jgi:hypothetical protein